LLQWITKEESNTSHFEIEKLYGTEPYSRVGNISAKGFSSLENRYEFKDLLAELGLNYYRLKMIDKDGHFTYSNIVTVQVKKGMLINTPLMNVWYVGDAVKFNISSAQQCNNALLLTDVSGRVLYKSNIQLNKGLNSVTVPVSLATSVYHATLINGVEKITHSFSVQ